MKRGIIICLLAGLIQNGFSQAGKFGRLSLPVIPKPVSAVTGEGYFLLRSSVSIRYDAGAAGEAALLADLLRSYTSLSLHSRAKEAAVSQISNAVVLELNKKPDTLLKKEGYRLQITKDRVSLSANTPQGLFYGVQTLAQLIQPGQVPGVYSLPVAAITDYPRFAYRGLMLDVSRHFFPKDFIKRYINEMAKYKLNVFHWHLTDDQGWRLEIKSLPELTRTGAWRVPRTGRWHQFEAPGVDEKAEYGGYYTQKDVREIIDYANKRFVTILPEIDVPAHSLALIASYPQLSCTKIPYPVDPGSNFYKKQDNVLCVANDAVWDALDKIFTEVAQLFPSEYIHIGGDEAYKGFWARCPADSELMKKESLANTGELQSFFVKKLEKLIRSKGKKMIGWDEILEGGLAPEATVMSWRGKRGGIEAARQGHEVIMPPILETYLSRKQSDAITEPFAPGMVRLSDCYGFEPVPDSVRPELVLGGEGCLWTEHITAARHAEYMTWPRAMALAETLWSSAGKRDFADFALRVEKQFPRLDAAGVKYAKSLYDPVVTPVKEPGDSMKVIFRTEMPGLRIYYSFDGSNPDPFYPLYKGEAIKIPKGATEVRAVAYRNDVRIGNTVSVSTETLRRALPGN